LGIAMAMVSFIFCTSLYGNHSGIFKFILQRYSLANVGAAR
jgi:hypothetical protein